MLLSLAFLPEAVIIEACTVKFPIAGILQAYAYIQIRRNKGIRLAERHIVEFQDITFTVRTPISAA